MMCCMLGAHGWSTVPDGIIITLQVILVQVKQSYR